MHLNDSHCSLLGGLPRPTVCGLLMPAAVRDSYFALRAFNVEVASIKDGHIMRNQGSPSTQLSSSPNNSEPADSTIALQLRIQWWRDAIAEIFKSGAISSSGDLDKRNMGQLSLSCWNSPVVRALARAHEQCNLTQRFLERIADAREVDLEIKQYETVNVLTSYADDTVGSLLYLTLETCGVREEAADLCAGYAGMGVGLTTALRAAPHRLTTGGEVTIPAELLRAGFPYHQLIPTYMAGDQDRNQGPMPMLEEDCEQWREAVQHMALTATHYLALAREQQSSVPKHARATLLPVVPSLQYLEKLEKANFNVFDSSLVTGSKSDRLRLLLLLGRTWMTGVF